jgi:hypothetical protein
MKISVETLFDCSVTGTTGNFKPSSIPHRDLINNKIHDYSSWSRSRNQQRNWETLLQVMGLRCQIENIESSQYRDGRWYFSFEVENPEIFGGELSLLKHDCQGVPMVTALDEDTPQIATIQTQDPDRNIWFTAVNT